MFLGQLGCLKSIFQGNLLTPHHKGFFSSLISIFQETNNEMKFSIPRVIKQLTIVGSSGICISLYIDINVRMA